MAIPSLRCEVDVPVTPEHAYRVFTERIGDWWPLATHSVFRTDTSVAIEGDRILERSADGRSSEWGRITASEPGARLAFTWHPGHEDERGVVDLAFAPLTEGVTRVTLVHSGWEGYGDGADAMRASYAEGWPLTLAAFAAATA